MSTVESLDLSQSAKQKNFNKRRFVKFADSCGNSLEIAKEFHSDEAPAAISGPLEQLSVTEMRRQLNIEFEQPASQPDFKKQLMAKYVVLENLLTRGPNIYATVLVKNISYEKIIRVRYTLDNWETFKEVDGNYVNPQQVPTTPEYDRFSFILRLPVDVKVGTRCLFAVQYIANNQHFWDNRSGDNFAIDVIELPFTTNTTSFVCRPLPKRDISEIKPALKKYSTFDASRFRNLAPANGNAATAPANAGMAAQVSPSSTYDDLSSLASQVLPPTVANPPTFSSPSTSLPSSSSLSSSSSSSPPKSAFKSSATPLATVTPNTSLDYSKLTAYELSYMNQYVTLHIPLSLVISNPSPHHTVVSPKKDSESDSSASADSQVASTLTNSESDSKTSVGILIST